MKVYVTGPMTGLPEYNYPAFHAAAASLRAAGYEVLSPAENGMPLGLPWEDYLRADIRMLLDCDAIVRLPGWEASRGATLEVHIATSLGMTLLPEVA